MFLPNAPGATFISGATSIPESRVLKNDFCLASDKLLGSPDKLNLICLLTLQKTQYANLSFGHIALPFEA